MVKRRIGKELKKRKDEIERAVAKTVEEARKSMEQQNATGDSKKI